MQVKVCPKCGAENRAANVSCSSCYTSLESVRPTLSKSTDRPARPQQAPGPGAPSHAPPYRSQPQVAQGGSYSWVLILVLLALAGGVVAVVMKSNKPLPEPAVTPDQVVLAFLQAKGTGDFQKVAPHLCAASLDKLNSAFSGKQAESAGIERADIHDMFLWSVHPDKQQLAGSDIKVENVQDDNIDRDFRAVHATITPRSGQPLLFETECDFVVVREENEWKVDLANSVRWQSGKSTFVK